MPKGNEDKEPKFRHVISDNTVNTGPPFSEGDDTQHLKVNDGQLSTADLIGRPRLAGNEPKPNPGDKSGLGETGNNQSNGVNIKGTPRHVRIS